MACRICRSGAVAAVAVTERSGAIPEEACFRIIGARQDTYYGESSAPPNVALLYKKKPKHLN